MCSWPACTAASASIGWTIWQHADLRAYFVMPYGVSTTRVHSVEPFFCVPTGHGRRNVRLRRPRDRSLARNASVSAENLHQGGASPVPLSRSADVPCMAFVWWYEHASGLWDQGRWNECFLRWGARSAEPGSRRCELGEATVSEYCALLSPSATVVAPATTTATRRSRRILGAVYAVSSDAVARYVSPPPLRGPNGRAAPHFRPLSTSAALSLFVCAIRVFLEGGPVRDDRPHRY